MTTQSSPVDSGWSWVILVAASIISSIWEGLPKMLSVLLPTLKDQFETHTWIIGIMITLMISVRDFSAPLVGALATRVNNNCFLASVGGTLVGFSLICASFANNVQTLVILISIISGISFALILIPTYALLGQCFDKFYPLASGVFHATGTVGIMIFAPLTQLLLSVYGWRSSLLIIGAITFHVIASAAVFRVALFESSTGNYVPLSSDPDLILAYSVSSEEDTYERNDTFGWMSEPIKQIRHKTCTFINLSGLPLFKNRSFLAICVMIATINTTYAGWVVYFIPHCLVKGLTLYEASLLSTAAGFSSLIGKVIYVPFVSRSIISTRGCICIAGTVSAIALFVDTFAVTITTISITNMLYTCGIGVAYPLCDVLMKSAVAPESLTRAFGWRMAVGGLVTFAPGFVLGWIYDHTGRYDGGFIFLSTVQAFGVVTLALDHLCQPSDNTRH